MSTVKSASAYDALGVTSSASDEDVKKSYRRLIRENHPDLGGDPSRFDEVQRAWEKVRTPEKRAAYDLRIVHSSSNNSSTSSSYEDFVRKQQADAARRRRMQEIDEELRMVNEKLAQEEALYFQREAAEKDRLAQEKRDSEHHWGIFTIDDEGISITLPDGRFLGASLVFFLVSGLGLGLFFATGLIGPVSFAISLALAVIVGFKVTKETWSLPAMRKTVALRITGAAASAYGYCLLTLLATLGISALT